MKFNIIMTLVVVALASLITLACPCKAETVKEEIQRLEMKQKRENYLREHNMDKLFYKIHKKERMDDFVHALRRDKDI